MKMTFKVLREYEARRVALLSSGAYIYSILAEDELEKIVTTDFSKVTWLAEPHAAIMRTDRRGAQARFAQSSTDGVWLKYSVFPPSFGSVRAFKSKVRDLKQLLTDGVKQEQWALAKRGAKSGPNLGSGFLVAPPNSANNTLVCASAAAVWLMPFELDPPAHGSHEQGVLRQLSVEDATLSVVGVNAAIRAIGACGIFSEHRNTAVEIAHCAAW